MLKKLKKNKLLILVTIIYIAIAVLDIQKAKSSVNNSMYYIKEMLQIMPVIFILTSLIEAWVPKNVIIKSLGENSGFKGKIFSFALGSFSAGPIYAAFPVCKTLINKGASISNIVIILSAWAVIKVPMLINEGKFLGLEFMVTRWILTIISILTMGYLVSIFVKKESIPSTEEEKSNDKNIIAVNKEYCIGCGICKNILPEKFDIKDGKVQIAKAKIKEDEKDSVKKAIEKCPVNAIYLT